VNQTVLVVDDERPSAEWTVRMTLNDERGEWLATQTAIPARQLRVTRLKGSTSSSVFLVEDREAVEPQRFVLRVLDNRAWLAE
jgi:hypothetical protein